MQEPGCGAPCWLTPLRSISTPSAPREIPWDLLRHGFPRSRTLFSASIWHLGRCYACFQGHKLGRPCGSRGHVALWRGDEVWQSRACLPPGPLARPGERPIARRVLRSMWHMHTFARLIDSAGHHIVYAPVAPYGSVPLGSDQARGAGKGLTGNPSRRPRLVAKRKPFRQAGRRPAFWADFTSCRLRFRIGKVALHLS